MQYMLQIYTGGAMAAYEQLSEEEKDAISGEYFAIAGMPGVSGGAQLQPATTATTVRVDGSDTLTTDGPFAETKEALGGYYLVEAETLDEAIEWAAKIPSARFGHIEVRPVVMRQAEVSA
jgi:hypothetical protein